MSLKLLNHLPSDGIQALLPLCYSNTTTSFSLYFDILFFMNLWRCRVDGDEEDIVSGEIPKRLQDMRIKK